LNGMDLKGELDGVYERIPSSGYTIRVNLRPYETL